MIVLLSLSQSPSRSETLRCVSRSPPSPPTLAPSAAMLPTLVPSGAMLSAFAPSGPVPSALVPSRPILPASRRVHPQARASAGRGFEGGVDAERQTGRVRVVTESHLGHDGDARLAEEVHEKRLDLGDRCAGLPASEAHRLRRGEPPR